MDVRVYQVGVPMTILVTGANGMLGSAVVRAAELQGIKVVGLSRQELRIADPTQVEAVLGRYPGATVINCAGIVPGRKDVSSLEMGNVNALGPPLLAKYAGRLVHVSTDCVFDGKITEGGYYEDATPNPLDDYGRGKLAGEAIPGHHLVMRASFVGLGQRGLLHWLLQHPEGAEVTGYSNWVWNGWTAAGFADVLLDLAQSDHTGLLHLPGPNVMSKAFLLERLADRLRPDLKIVEGKAPQGRWMVLKSREPITLPHLSTHWFSMLDQLEEEYKEFRQNELRWEILQASLEYGSDYRELGHAKDDDPL